MATFKCLIRPTDKKQDGTWNVKIRVTHNRQSRYISTPFFVTDEQITRGYKIKDRVVLDQVENKMREWRVASDKIGFLAEGVGVDHLIELIQNKADKKDFFAFMDDHIKKLEKDGRTKTAAARSVARNSFVRFVGKDRLYFSDIDSNLMLRYFEHIRQELKPGSVETYITAIKCMYKDAQRIYNDDENNIIVVKYGVFKKIVMPNNVEFDERSFETPAQMQAVIDAPYTGIWCYDFAKDMFVLSFIMFGINPVDLFFAKKDQVVDGILSYRRSKIKRRNVRVAEKRIRLNDVARIILDKYSCDKEYLIDFRGHSRRTTVVSYIHAAFQDAGLEPYDKKVRSGHGKGKYVFYTARHSMATFARNICKIDWDVVNDMLNHTPRNNTNTTDVYIKKDWNVQWEANEKLLALFDWSFYTNQHSEKSDH